MIEHQERVVKITEEEVEEWCDCNEDDNPLHTDEEAASDGTFGERVVPGMLLMDKLSGVVTNMAEEDETVILSGITAARFRDPVLLDEEIHISIDVDEETKKFTSLPFEIRVPNRGSLVANGVLTVVVR